LAYFFHFRFSILRFPGHFQERGESAGSARPDVPIYSIIISGDPNPTRECQILLQNLYFVLLITTILLFYF